jgi:O-antigen/teichoic acid export membrane protein
VELRQKLLIVFAGQGVALAANFTANVIVARRLGPAASGEFDLLRQFQTFFVGLCSLGISTAVIYCQRKALVENRALLAGIRDSAALSIPLYMAVAGLVALLYPQWFSHGSLSPGRAFALAAGACLVLAGFLRAFWVANSRYRNIFLLDCLSPCLFLAFVLAFVSGGAGRGAVEAVFAAWGASLLLPALLLAAWLWKTSSREPFDLKRPLQMAGFGGRALVANLCYIGMLNVLYFMLRRENVPFSEIGLLTRAVALSSAFLMPVTSISIFVFAKWTGSRPEHSLAALGKWSAASAAYFGFLAVGAFLWGSGLISLLYGPRFREIESLLLPVLGVSFLMALYTGLYNIFASSGRPGRTIPYLLAANLAIAAGAILAPRLDAGVSCKILLAAYGVLVLASLLDVLAQAARGRPGSPDASVESAFSG